MVSNWLCNLYFWPKWCNRDKINPPTQNNHNTEKKIHETMIAKILYTRWWKAMILRDGKQGEPYNCTSLLPLESFQTNSTVRGIQAKPIGHSWVEEMIRNTKMSRIHRTELQISPVFRKSALCHFALTEDLH